MLRQIASLYQVEKSVRGHAPADFLAVRSEHSAPVISALRPCPETQLSSVPQKSLLAEDILYTLAHWPGLVRFLDDGTLVLDTNSVANQIRPIALTRENALFAGNELGAENRAVLASLVATCNLTGRNPVDHFTHTLRAILDGRPGSRIENLVRWRHALPSSLAVKDHVVALKAVLLMQHFSTTRQLTDRERQALATAVWDVSLWQRRMPRSSEGSVQ